MDVPYNQSFEDERANMRSRAEWQHPMERIAGYYPPRFPTDVDRAHLAYDKPTTVVRPVDTQAQHAQLFESFNRHHDDIKIRFANTPGPSCVPFNIARANGHVTGAVGALGNLVTDELNEELGGGYALKYSK